MDLAPLTLVVARLREGPARHQLNASDTLIRGGLIQRFKVTYDLSHRTLKLALAITSANPAELEEAADLLKRLKTPTPELRDRRLVE